MEPRLAVRRPGGVGNQACRSRRRCLLPPCGCAGGGGRECRPDRCDTCANAGGPSSSMPRLRGAESSRTWSKSTTPHGVPFDSDHGSLGRGQCQGSRRVHDVSFSRAGQGSDAGRARGTSGPTPGPFKGFSLGLWRPGRFQGGARLRRVTCPRHRTLAGRRDHHRRATDPDACRPA